MTASSSTRARTAVWRCEVDEEVLAGKRRHRGDRHRLDRAEYANVVRDLLALDAADVVSTLPSDEATYGFDSIAESLNLSPTLIESYLAAAMRISRAAIGDRTMIQTRVTYKVPAGAQDRHVDGLPLGTRGGMRFTHNFPLDAEYEIRIVAQGPREGARVLAPNYCELNFPDIDVILDGASYKVEDYRSFRLAMKAEPRTIGVALVDNFRCEGATELYEWFSAIGAIESVEIHGPYDATGAGDTPSRQAILVCRPTAAESEERCARRILSNLPTRAYRRSVRAGDVEIEPLIAFYREGRFGTKSGDFETGIQYALSRLLIDPRFLFRLEEQPSGLGEDEIYRVSDQELASRLSFFLWSSIPDMELLELAARGS
jgi:hypothetical protein